MKPKIVLHIGHGKTGTSAIQAALARNHELLKSRGVLYPEHPSFELARSGKVTSGNLNSTDNWFEGQVIDIVRKNPGYSTYIFSNEDVFWKMYDFVGPHIVYRDEYDFEILLFFRNPLELLSSGYQQWVKRAGFFGDISEFAPLDTHIVDGAAVVRAFERHNICFKLFNYSTIRRDVVRRFFDHLGLWDDLIDQGGAHSVGIVNRSLTAAELGFVRYINQIFGAEHGKLLSDSLVNELPDIVPDIVPIDEATTKDFCARNEEAVRYLNSRLPPSEQITLYSTEQSGRLNGLSSEQVSIIRRALSNHLLDSDGAALCDIALRIEQGAPLNRSDAITLMDYANRARPNCQIITKKLEEWRQPAARPAGFEQDGQFPKPEYG